MAATWVGPSPWLAFHLFREDALDALLCQIVKPIIQDLLARQRIHGFFFIRYPEGGHHIRLRLRLPPDAAGVRGTAEETRLRLEQDCASAGCTPVPAPFEPEVERYGGAQALPASLNLFVLSSLDALNFAEEWRHAARGRQLSEALLRILGLALELAGDTEELMALLDYFSGWRAQMGMAIAKADAFFDLRQDTLLLHFQETVAPFLEENTSPAPLAEGCRALTHALDTLEPPRRRGILGSQLHMAANRMGLLNAEEGYLTRLLCRCASRFATQFPETWRSLDDALRARRVHHLTSASAPASVPEWMSQALTRFAQAPASRPAPILQA
ncbi:thiopeptide-type bacteriocin biosynthesis protein [Corallococcus caeni]|uniref:thiopeptide-type bacteriocin biosynthesis protein n=1 Tax=Corallococcus caeni TaxID=3082388 RepID=UPI0030C7437E